MLMLCRFYHSWWVTTDTLQYIANIPLQRQRYNIGTICLEDWENGVAKSYFFFCIFCVIMIIPMSDFMIVGFGWLKFSYFSGFLHTFCLVFALISVKLQDYSLGKCLISSSFYEFVGFCSWSLIRILILQRFLLLKLCLSVVW